MYSQSDQLLQPNARLYGAFGMGTSGQERGPIHASERRRLLQYYVIGYCPWIKKEFIGAIGARTVEAHISCINTYL
jgi:hypothetical protein